MAVWKRFKGRKVVRGHKDYDKGTWIAEGKVDGVPYKTALPKETFKTAAEARAEDDKIREQIRTGEFDYRKDKTTFSSYVDNQYLIYVQNNIVDVYHKKKDLHRLKQFFGDTKLKAISPSMCESFKAWRSAQRVTCRKCTGKTIHTCSHPLIKPATVNLDIGTLSSIFSRAVVDRKMDRNPIDAVPRLEEERFEGSLLTPDQRVKLFEVLKDDYQLFRIALIGLLTGWRKNQVLHLSKPDLIDGKVRIIKQKGSPSRTVPVHPMVWQILIELAEHRDHWLFIGPSGDRRKTIDTAWGEAKRKAGVRIRFHDLRHTLASEIGDILLAQHALGHTSGNTTMGYLHLKDDQLLNALLRMKVDDIPMPDAIQTPSERVM